MSNFVGYGTLTTDTSTTAVSCRGHTTLTAHLDSGTGTLVWQFMGPDGVWRSIYGGSGGITEQTFTASHMANVFFGGDVNIRATGSSGTNPVWDWQIIGNPANR